MRRSTRIAAAFAAGIVGTVLMASPSFAAGGPAGSAGAGGSQQTARTAGTCDGTGAQLHDRLGTHQQDRVGTGDHLRLRIHKA
jgi:hypothetical protein